MIKRTALLAVTAALAGAAPAAALDPLPEDLHADQAEIDADPCRTLAASEAKGRVVVAFTGTACDEGDGLTLTGGATAKVRGRRARVVSLHETVVASGKDVEFSAGPAGFRGTGRRAERRTRRTRTARIATSVDGLSFDGAVTKVTRQVIAGVRIGRKVVSVRAVAVERFAGPDPVGRDPVGPDPLGPDPTTPDPTEPDPTTPDPITPDPVQPDPVEPDPVHPDPVIPDPTYPDPTFPDPTIPDPVDDLGSAPVAHSDVQQMKAGATTYERRVRATDADGDIVRYNLHSRTFDSSGALFSWNPGTGQFTLRRGSPSGWMLLRFTAVDSRGNVSPVGTFQFRFL